MRSKLFVPGSRPELFAKALASDADAISIDLEDSVAGNRKAEARALVGKFLQSAEIRASNKIVIVRVNALSTPHFEADLLAIAQPGLALLNLPKPEFADDIRAAVAVLERAEAANGVNEPIRILANIESPKGLRNAAEIAAAHARVSGLQLGYGDLFEPLGIDRRDAASVHAVMFAVRMAAGAVGVFAYDGAFADLQDPAGFRAEAEMARRLGYWGKSCIHPSQIALANEVFRPSDAEVAFALRVLEAYRQADARGVGAFTVDGRMIDIPFIRRAEAIVAVSRRMASKA
ncbi:MAG: HpcH/HpaI aldolase/citrate lyase family protein [Gammaproteobacteria bacterium]